MSSHFESRIDSKLSFSQTNWQGEGDRRGHGRLLFQVTVTFPQTSDGSPLSINHFGTDLERFSQTFGNVSNVDFKWLDLKGSIGGIYAGVSLISIAVPCTKFN